MPDAMLYVYVTSRLRTAMQRHAGLPPVVLQPTDKPKSLDKISIGLPDELVTGVLQMLQGRAMVVAANLLRDGEVALPAMASSLVVALTDKQTIDVVLDVIDMVLPGQPN